MSELKATPGPWLDNLHAGEKRDGGRFYVHVLAPSSGVVPIACVPTGVEGYGREEGRANARLIAAAPELCASAEETHAWVRRIQDVMCGYLVPDGYDADEALNRLIEMLDGPEQREIQGRARAALAKVRGE